MTASGSIFLGPPPETTARQSPTCSSGLICKRIRCHDACHMIQTRKKLFFFFGENSEYVCWGFSIMRRYEGPSTAFDMLVRRFPEAPGMVVYDNACNLSRYALNREPGLFAQTRFRIDRVHQACHVGCHEGYSLTSYPDDCPVLGRSMRLHAGRWS